MFLSRCLILTATGPKSAGGGGRFAGLAADFTSASGGLRGGTNTRAGLPRRAHAMEATSSTGQVTPPRPAHQMTGGRRGAAGGGPLRGEGGSGEIRPGGGVGTRTGVGALSSSTHTKDTHLKQSH
jgi:hypothetical protein